MDSFGNDFVVLTDEDGKEMEFEHLDTLEYEGETYMAFIPAEQSVEESCELVILKLAGEEGSDEEVLLSIEDEDELETVFQLFTERLEDYYEAEEDCDEALDEDDESI